MQRNVLLIDRLARLAFLGGLIASAAAHAQLGVPLGLPAGGTPAAGLPPEGPGIRAGERLVLHPGFSLAIGHDSNIFYSPSNNPILSGAYIALRPVLDLATRGAAREGEEGPNQHRLNFRLHSAATVRFLITGNPNIDRRYISADVDVGGQLVLFPLSPWTFELFDNLGRTSVPPYYPVLQPSNLNFVTNDFGFRVRWRPGRGAGGAHGRLEASLAYRLSLFAFEQDRVSTQFRPENYLYHDFQLRAQWRFFPKTAVFLNLQETIYQYYARGPGTPPSSYPLRITAGLIGQWTNKIRFNVSVGYGNGFYDRPDVCSTEPQPGDDPNARNACISPQTVTARLDFQWTPTDRTNIALIFHHDFAASLIGSYYDIDAIALSAQQRIWRLFAGLRFVWEERRFRGDLVADNIAQGRRDDLFSIHFDVSYPIRRWLVVSVGDQAQINVSNCALQTGSGTSNPLFACNYRRNDFFVRAAFAY